MSADEYTKQHHDAKRLYLNTLANEYHETVEAYDRTVCTGPIVDGSITPSNDEERHLVNRNALVLLHRFVKRAMVEHGIRRVNVEQAISYIGNRR